MSRYLAFVAIVAFVVVGCSKKEPVDKIAYIADDDPRMNAAIEKARSTVGTFIAALKSPTPSQSGFSVKMAFVDGDQTEFMWLTAVTFDGTNFQGTVNNEPEHVKTVKMGQKATIARSKIGDWMYIENRKLIGGYTIRVIRDNFTPAEGADFDKSVPFVVE